MFRRCAFWSWGRLQCALLWLGPARPAGWSAWAGRQPNIDLPSPYLTQTNTGPSKHCTAAILVIFSNQSRTSILLLLCLPTTSICVIVHRLGMSARPPPRHNGESKFCGFGRWAADVAVGGGGFIWFIGQQFPENSLIGRQRDQWQWCQQKHMAPEER